MRNFRDRLRKLFAVLGSDNLHERDNARNLIDDLLRKRRATWSDLPGLFGLGTSATINPDLANHVAGLGSQDPDERRNVHQWIADLLARKRKNWNDLTDLLSNPVSPSWADDDNNNTSPPGSDIPNIPDLIHRLVEWYVWLQPHEAVAVALWVMHCHVFAQFRVTPRLVLTSPVRGCGKTVLLSLLAKWVPKPLKTDAISPAAIYHSIDNSHSTLLVDEGDNLGFEHVSSGRLRAVFNSGHRRGGNVTLLNRGHPRSYSTFAPLALAGIGSFPLPLMHRSVVISMQRYDGQSELKQFDEDDCPEVDYVYPLLYLWGRSVAQGSVALERDPAMPPELRNRVADNWRPLIAIADSFGPEWGRLAREAAITFASIHQDEDAAVILLGDIRSVFDTRRVDRLPSATLAADLNAMDNAMWSEWRGARGNQQPRRLSQGELAKLLKPFGIRPQTIWPLNRVPGSKSSKGYYKRQFEAAWASYCSDDGTTAQPNNIRTLDAVRGTRRDGTS
jgi:hypothetical protein